MAADAAARTTPYMCRRGKTSCVCNSLADWLCVENTHKYNT